MKVYKRRQDGKKTRTHEYSASILITLLLID